MSDLLFKLLRDARQPNDPDLLMGYCHYLGLGTRRNYGHALRYFLKSAQRGSPWAEYAIGLMYDSGKGLDHNPVKALAWYVRAAQRGYLPALCALAEIQESKRGAPERPRIA